MNLLKFLWTMIKVFFARKKLAISQIGLPVGHAKETEHPVEALIAPEPHTGVLDAPKVEQVLGVLTQVEAVIEECPTKLAKIHEHSEQLQNLDASFVQCTRNPGIHHCHMSTEASINHGLHFLCPGCRKHYILCLFKHPSVPDEALPKERFTRENAVYGVPHVTIVEPIHANECGWVGIIKDGVVSW